MNILMIEDNEAVSEMMQMFFLNEGWEATFQYDGQEGLDAFLAEPEHWDMITLDLNLPGLDGMAVAREIRKISKTVPIIMLTARDSESDQVIGLEMGADDYVTKPFSPLTLIARMKALHRRSELVENVATEKEDDESFDIVTKHFKMNTKTREAYLDDTLIDGLTPKEFDLLYTLAKKPRQVFSREQLLELVWDYQYFGDERTVDAHIKKLRQKIEKVGPQVIQTVWGVGYKFDDSGVA
ncbi:MULTISPECIES: response regulator transcription factor [Enterococcus]|jgi:DNA-binding response OmpR family regulator|uniref:Two-component system response regulator receiver protein n=1 Tax=Enterococcus dispar ATCC 51266 TaxID=1139219 RepID=S1N8T4_9ENTE|nr:response regulator transcription factor [Enterococcus dispar]EOT43077.1 two-component system response regulator receiver protein [Enterococcus dispar ATCC 51266]EOW85475.1 two-component system response regulator receiver protein [Enterococcus dispar ATCC 51266]MCU7358205.1 response regulator transcription factor [Enterococcus dispar]MDT2705777.1 response regulator transcription factor [Enterococcus dispar]OJG37684.1 two-component system response regulator receiver protein [Enterococcus disp